MKALLVSILAFCTLLGMAQERVTTFGFQVKPIIPSNLLRTGAESVVADGIIFTTQQRVGYSFGGVIRKGITEFISLETGINYTRRNFSAHLLNEASNFADTTQFRIIGYEIPVTGLVFVRLSEYLFMDGAFGLAFDMFPSDVESSTSNFFTQTSIRTSWSKSRPVMTWVNSGLIANVGFEYRTEQKGYFYLGASFHRPFRPIYNTTLVYGSSNVVVGKLNLSGNYLTIDLKYFFHEEPERRNPAAEPQEKRVYWKRDS